MIFKRSYNILKNKETVLVTDEGEFPIWSRDFDKSFSHLSSGDEVVEEELLRTLAYRREIKKKAIRRLSSGDITKKALSKRLSAEKAFGVDSDREFIDALLQKLENAGYIDDGAYAKRYLSKCLEKLWGERKIRGEMMLKGFSAEHIEGALTALEPDFVSMVRELISSKYEGVPRETLYRRLYTRGFRGEEISEALDQVR